MSLRVARIVREGVVTPLGLPGGEIVLPLSVANQNQVNRHSHSDQPLSVIVTSDVKVAVFYNISIK